MFSNVKHYVKHCFVKYRPLQELLKNHRYLEMKFRHLSTFKSSRLPYELPKIIKFFESQSH